MGIHWWLAPEAGDIVWCHFPENKGIKPGPKPRPALIVTVYDDHAHDNAKDRAPQFWVSVAYGTSQKTDNLLSGEFLVTDQRSAPYLLAGLSYPTKFSFRSMVELPFNSDWFKVPPAAPHHQSPKLGVLHPSLMKAAKAAYLASTKPTK